MTLFSRARVTDAKLAAHLDAELPKSEAMLLEAELRTSTAARMRLEQLRGIRARLASDVQGFEPIDLTPAIHARLAESSKRQASRATWPRWGGLVTALTVVGLAVGLIHSPFALRQPEFRSKAAHGDASLAPTWTELRAYKARDGARPEPLIDRVSQHDGWLFSYTNSGAQPFEYLMVFALDATAQVRWFYPAHERADADPQSIRIAPQHEAALLPEVIEHDFALGELTVFALFTHEPLRVSEVERWVERNDLRPDSLSRSAKLLKLALEVTQ